MRSSKKRSRAFDTSRRFLIQGDLDEKMRARLLVWLETMRTEGVRSITIVFNSEGGLTYDGRIMADAVRSFPGTVRGEVLGEASSSAAFVFMACDERVMSRNSELLLHFGEEPLDIGETATKRGMKRQLKKNRKFVRDICDECRQKTVLSRRDMRRILFRDAPMSAATALKKGLIHEII